MERLKSLGLTEYQARVYIAMLDYDSTSANQIPAISRVPRTKIYGIMRELHEKGLVNIIPERPLKYRAVPLEKFLRSRVNEIRQSATELEESIPDLASEFEIKSKTPQVRGNFEVIFSRRNNADKIKDMIGRAEKCVTIMGSEHSAEWVVRVLLGAVKDRSEENVEFIFGFPATENNKTHMERLEEYSSVRHITHPESIMTVVIDDSEGVLIHRIPDDGNSYKGDDIGMWTDDDGIVKAMMALIKDPLDWSIDFKSHNAFGPITKGMIRWINGIGLSPEAVLPHLGKAVGDTMARKVKVKELEKVISHMDKYWKREHIGSLEIMAKRPLKLKVDTSMDCHSNMEISDSLCTFIKTVVESMLRGTTGDNWKITGTDCPSPEEGDYCVFLLKKEKE